MPEVGSWKQRVSSIFCHILLLSKIIKFIFQTWNALKVASSRQSLRHNTDSAYNFVAYDLVKSALSEPKAEVED